MAEFATMFVVTLGAAPASFDGVIWGPRSTVDQPRKMILLVIII
jgi:hypothetical protein